MRLEAWVVLAVDSRDRFSADTGFAIKRFFVRAGRVITGFVCT
jgi:hypothetical protein